MLEWLITYKGKNGRTYNKIIRTYSVKKAYEIAKSKNATLTAIGCR